MATLAQLEQALINADRAGRTEDARILAQELQRAMGGATTDPFAEEARIRAELRRSSPEESGFIENILSGFGSGFVGTGEVASLGAATLLDEEAELAAREKIKAAADYLRPEGGDEESISYKIASGLGSVAGALTPAALAAIAPISAPVAGAIGLGGAAAIGVGSGAGEASERARAAGATEEERNEAVRLGALIGSTEVLPLGRILRIPGVSQLAEKIGGEVVEGTGRKIRRALATGAEEGAQEAAAGMLQNLVEQGYNPERALVDAGILEEGLIGASSGVILQSVVDFFVKGKTRRTATEGTDAAAEPAEPFGVAEPADLSARADQQTDLAKNILGEEASAQAAAREREAALAERQALAAANRGDERAFDEAAARAQQPDLFALEKEQERRRLGPEELRDPEQYMDTVEMMEEAPATPERGPEQLDLVDRIDQMELNDAEIAEIEAIIRADEEAVADLDRIKQKSALETVDARRESEQQKATESNRYRILQDTIENTPTRNYNTLSKNFEKALADQGIKNTKTTEREMETIRKAVNVQRAEKPTVEEPSPITPPPEATQLEEMEARIPERKAPEPVAEPSQLSFPGMGRRKTPPVKETPQAPKVVTQEFMDGLGISKAAPIRKRTEGKDLNDPTIRQEFVKFANNPKVAQQTRLNVARELEGVPEAQLELFQPQPRGRAAQPQGAPDARDARATQPAGRGASVPTTGLPVGARQGPPATAGDTQVPATPRPRGLDNIGRGVGEPVRAAGPEQLALDLLEPVTRPKVAETPKAEPTKRKSVRKAKAAPKSVKKPAVKAMAPKRTRKVQESVTTPKQVTTKAPKKTTSTTRKVMPTLQIKKTTPALAPTDSTTKQLRAQFEKQNEQVQKYAKELSNEFTETVGNEKTTPDDQLKILSLLTSGAQARDKNGNAVVTYLSKYPRPSDGLYAAIYDVANESPQFRRTNETTASEIAIFEGTGKKTGQRVLDWAKANLSEQTNKWIDETLAQEIRDMQRIESTDYVELFRQRDAKLAAKELAEQAQFEAEMRQDLRENLEELSRIFEKKLERGSVMGLDINPHPAVRVALRKGDLRGALVNLATWSPSSRVRQVASKLANTVNDRARLAEAQRATQGSKVKGIVYHGSYKTDIAEFKSGDLTKGLYFSPDRGLAESYMGRRKESDRGRVYEVMLDIKNPLIVKGSNNTSFMDKIAVALGRKTEKELRAEQRKVRTSSMVLSEKDIADLKRQGYDGIMNEDAREYVVFDASQVHMVDSLAGGTQVEVVKNLRAKDGKPVAGLFDPETNNIKLDADMGMNPHVILHEVTHAATSATLANKSHPLTKQLTKLYEDVKDYLDTAYGAKDVDEFVSEAFSNPEFQAKLATINPDGSNINALQRFFNSVGNFLRKLVGMQTKPVESAQTVADRLIEGILAPAPASRNSPELAMKSTRDGVKEVIKDVDNTQQAASTPNATPQFRKTFGTRASNIWDRGGEGVKFILPKLLDAQALADMAYKVDKRLGDVATRFYETVDRMRGSMADADNEVRLQIKTVDKWAKKAGKKGKEHLDNLIYSEEYGATIYQVDPTKPRKEYEGKTDESGNDLAKVWDAQRADWKALGQEGQNAYRTMQNMYRNLYMKLKDVINGRIDALLKDNPDAAKELKRGVFAELFDKNTLDVYFPLLREGRYKLEFSYKADRVKSSRDQYVFQMFEDKAERDWVMEQLKNDPDVDQSTVKKGDGDFSAKDFNNAPSTSFVGEVLSTLRGNKVSDDVQSEVMRLFVNSLPESSFAKSLQRRKNTPGYMNDAVYAAKTKGFDLARQVEKLKYTSIFQQMEAEMDQIKPTQDQDDYKLNTIKESLSQRMQFAKYGSKNKYEWIARTANQIAFVYTLGGNVASATVQLFQMPMFVYPMLGARYGYQQAYNEIMNAASLVTGARMQADKISETEGMGGKAKAIADKISIAHGLDAYYDRTENGDFVVKKDKDVPAEKQKELERLAPLVKMMYERGHLNRSFLFDALGLQEGGKARRANTLLRKAAAALDIGTALSAAMFNQSERFNRQVSAVAAYNLALERISKESPNTPLAQRQEQAAREALYDTQEYNGGSTLETAPPIAQEGFGRVAMMYKTYGLRMYYNMIKTGGVLLDNVFAKDAEGKQMRNIALKQMVGIHASALFFAGVHGIPIYGAAQLFFDLFLLGEEDDDVNTIVRNYVGEGWYKGAFNQILDQFGAGADIASRVRLTGLLFQENRYNADPSAEEWLGQYLGGPAWSISKRIGRGVQDLYNGEFERGVESIVPTAVTNAMKASPLGRYQQEGGVYTRRKDPIYDDLTGGELVAQFFGFAPAEYIRRQEESAQVKRIDIALGRTRSNLMKRYYVAARMGDWAEIRKINSEIIQFNRDHPSFEISPESINKSMDQHIKTSEEMYNGISLSPAMRRAIEDHLYGIRNGFTPPIIRR